MSLTEGQPPGPAPAEPAAAVSAAQAAVADMRATARWIIAAFAAAGSVLLGGLPLAGIGKVEGGPDTALATGGLVMAVLGVAWAIWHTSEALTPRLTTLRVLTDPTPREARALKDLHADLTAAPRAFYGPFGTTPGELDAACRLHATVAARLEELLVHETDDTRRAEATHRLGLARANAEQALRRRRALLELAHAWQVRGALRRARLHTVAGAFAVVAGAVVFLLATTS
ncbi:hypothetical protein AB0L35_15665 [Streptomyces sp. NPDC052309]|uniref:hypothetical protein n=1 Tax=Streptomyces sp. NPDC052309 TaxID=3155421 RepID=UPI003428A64E